MEPNAYGSEQVVTQRNNVTQQEKEAFLLKRHNPTIICETQARRTDLFSAFKREEENEAKDCSSEEEHKVNALASRADEGRDNLR